jgi:hypothetical protein
MTVHSAWLALNTQSRVDTRLAMSTTMTPSANLVSRSGLVADGGFALQSVSAMQCQITPGRAYVQGVLSQGAYPVAVDAAVPLTVPDGDPQYGRIDLVVLRIRDDQFDGSGVETATVELVAGTPAATPVAPAVPAASLGLWLISVPAKTSAGGTGVSWSTATTDLRVYTASLGGIVPFGATAWQPPAAGQYSDINGGLQRWNGSAWSQVYDPTTLGNLPQVTSTTRPSAPALGKQVFETNTGRVSLWNGSVWETVFDPNPAAPTWVSPTILSPFSGNVQLTKIGTFVYLRGFLFSSSWTAGTTNIMTFPAGYIPSIGRTINCLASPNGAVVPAQLTVNTTGSVSLWLGTTSTNSGNVWCDGLFYSL